jgi:CRISPR-associated protein Csm5
VRYKFTCLTPLLVGDGQELSPIDYMVWKDQVNVLDQRRIFRLLAKGPRLDNYLAQLKRADRLDFASWGGFAQNFAGRRIPFEHSSCAVHWARSGVEALRIPTFASGPSGPFLPGTALKGALRTGMVHAGLKDGSLERMAALFQTDRPPRHPGEILEERALGSGGASRMRVFQTSDSAPVAVAAMRVYLLRVASLKGRSRDGYTLGWKQSPSGTVDGARPEDSTPTFAEMATPGTVFEGGWRELDSSVDAETRQALNWKGPFTRETLFEAANNYAGALIEAHKTYTEGAGLAHVREDLGRLEEHLTQSRQSGNACLLSVGWGGGLLSRIAWLKTDDPAYREIIVQSGLYGKSPYPGFPFPKTRRVVFLEDRPAALPGWGLLEVSD